MAIRHHVVTMTSTELSCHSATEQGLCTAEFSMPPSANMRNSKAYQTLTSTISKMTGNANLKAKDLEHSLKDSHDGKNRLTSDTGVKQNNTDDWLRIVNDDQTGPMLLEDTFAREKVRDRLTRMYSKSNGEIDSQI
jgi:hypothetical protein